MKLRFGGWTGALVIVLSMAQSANALDWEVKRVFVEEAHIFKSSGTTVMRVVYKVVNGFSTKLPDTFGCSVNHNPLTANGDLYQASYWDGGVSLHHQNYLSSLLAAQAQGRPVDIRFDSSGCNTNDSSYGLGGLGRGMAGVKVLPNDQPETTP